jgi:hypothetical protein
MSKTAIAIITAVTVLNVGATIINVTRPANAEVAGMNARQLERDRDFRRAVESIVSSCTVNRESISC